MWHPNMLGASRVVFKEYAKMDILSSPRSDVLFCNYFNPNCHEVGHFPPSCPFWISFASWIFIKNFETFLEVKIDINWVNLTPKPSSLSLLKSASRWRQRWAFFLFSELMPIRVKVNNQKEKKWFKNSKTYRSMTVAEVSLRSTKIEEVRWIGSPMIIQLVRYNFIFWGRYTTLILRNCLFPTKLC